MDAANLQSLTLDALRARLTEALDAQHKLLTGARTVAVGKADRRVQYSEADAHRLDGYIAALRSAIAAKASGRPLRRGPITLGVGGGS